MIIALKIAIILFVFIFFVMVSLQAFKKLFSFIDARKQKIANQSKKSESTEKEQAIERTNKTLKDKNTKILIPLCVFFIFLLISGKIIIALLLAILIFMGINAYQNKHSKKEIDKFEDQLVEALGMLSNSVNAGQSLMQGIENMVKDTKPPISVEFEEALRQVRLGKSITEALVEITKRVKSKDLTMAITSINLSRETGGNIGEILSRLCTTIRERKKIKGKIVSLTAQGRASGIVMSSIPAILLGVLYLIEPGMMGLLFSTVAGNLMLLLAGLMISAGMFFISKIVSIDI